MERLLKRCEAVVEKFRKSCRPVVALWESCEEVVSSWQHHL